MTKDKEEIKRKIALLTAELDKPSQVVEDELSSSDTDSVDFQAGRNADPPGFSTSSIFDNEGINQVTRSIILTVSLFNRILESRQLFPAKSIRSSWTNATILVKMSAKNL